MVGIHPQIGWSETVAPARRRGRGRIHRNGLSRGRARKRRSNSKQEVTDSSWTRSRNELSDSRKLWLVERWPLMRL